MLRLLLPTALLALAGCATEYRYTPPATEDGRLCVVQCQGAQERCRSREDRRTQDQYEQCRVDTEQDQARCERDGSIEYTACLRYAKTDAERAACKPADCSKASCYNNPSYDLCDADFRVCYQNCGGQVEVLKN